MDEKEFITLAIKRGLITFDQAHEAVNTQQALGAQGLPIPIWEALVRKNCLTAEQAQSILTREQTPKSYGFGPFRIEGKIGEGGMGTVYRARKQGDDKTIALKILPDRFSTGDYVKRFEREATVAITLAHPNLVKGYEHGNVNNRWYYSMEFVKGKVLSVLVKDKGPLDEPSALKILLQVAGALETIHRNGLVHRDIKPENIILGESGIAKLMDLGLVKSTLADMTALTQSGYTMGTPHYMSPEQIEGRNVDTRSDIYSLGATLYFLLTGIKPFQAEGPMEAVKKQLVHDLEDPRLYRPNLTDPTYRLIRKLMARMPADRIQTAGELIETVTRILEGKPTALPAPRPARASKVLAPPAPERSSWPLVACIVGGAVLAIAAFAMLPSSPPPRPQPQPVAVVPPPPIDGSIEAEKTVRRLAEEGSFNEAIQLLKAENLGKKRPELERFIQGQAAKAWEAVRDAARKDSDLTAARRRILDFQPRVRELSGFHSQMELELQEIAAAEKKSKFKNLEDRIRPAEAKGDFEQAIAILEREADPTLQDLISGRIQWLKEQIAKRPPPVVGPDPEVEILWTRASGHADSQRWDDAILTLTDLLRRFPAEARSHALRARCFLKKDNIPNASSDAVEAIRLQPTNALAHRVLGLVYLRKKLYRDAVASLTRSIATDPTSGETFFRRAEALVELSQSPEALKDLEEAARLNVPPREILMMRLRALQGEAAIQECTRWLEREPKDVSIYLVRARLYVAAGKSKEAQADFAKVLTLDPKNAEALAGRDATKPIEPPKPAAKPAKLTPSEIKKKLAAYLNASIEQITVQSDGQVRVALDYDFSKKEQLDDFWSRGASVTPRSLSLAGSDSEPAELVHKAPLTGDFLIRVQVAGLPNDALGCVLRTTNMTHMGDREDGGDGVGLSLLRDESWWIRLEQKGASRKTLADDKSVQFGANDVVGVGLKREGAKFTGYVASQQIEGTKPGFDMVRLRFVTWDSVKLVRVELQGTLDAEWVRKVIETPEGKPAALWNAANWEAVGATLKGDAIDAQDGIGFLKLKDPQARPAHFELTLAVDEKETRAVVGFALVVNGNRVESEGNFSVSFGKTLTLHEFKNGDWSIVQKATPETALQKGENKVELIVRGSDLIFRAGGSELKAPGMLPPEGSFRLAIVVQNLKGRVVGVNRK